jgi:hypothetical protein
MENKTEIMQRVLKKCSKFPCAWFYNINFWVFFYVHLHVQMQVVWRFRYLLTS